MAAIVTLTEARKAKLVKCLNNLNLGFVFSGFGEAFAAMIEGAPLTLDEAKKAELKHLINNLNLGTFHAKAGDLLVDLMDHGTSNATAKAMTEGQKTQLAALFHNLNMGLAEVDVGDLIVAAVEDLGHPTAAPKLVWDGTVPTTGTIGKDVDFAWKGGTPDYKVTIKNPAGTDHDTRAAMPDLTYSMHTTSQAAGDWTIIVEDAAGVQLTQKVTMAAAPKVLKTIKLTGKEIALTGDATAGYVIADLKIDASNQDEITVAVATDVGAAMPADAAIKVEIFTAANSADLAKLEAISVSGGKFIIKAAATGAPADGDTIDLKVTAGAAAPVKLSAKFIA